MTANRDVPRGARGGPPTAPAGGSAGRRARWRARGAPLGLALAVLLAAPLSGPEARAHDEAVIESAASAVPAGGALDIQGRDFTGGEAYALRLVGALREYDLRRVEPGPDGTFALELEIPADVVPGAYQLVAVAPDGDVVARLDLQLLAPSRASGGEPAADHAAMGHGAAAARSDDIRIERDRSGVEWGAIGLVVGLAGGLGLGLLRRG